MSDEQEKGTREEQESQEEGTMKDLEEKVDQVDLQAAGGSGKLQVDLQAAEDSDSFKWTCRH